MEGLVDAHAREARVDRLGQRSVSTGNVSKLSTSSNEWPSSDSDRVAFRTFTKAFIVPQ
jgi:hypothetical protein